MNGLGRALRRRSLLAMPVLGLAMIWSLDPALAAASLSCRPERRPERPCCAGSPASAHHFGGERLSLYAPQVEGCSKRCHPSPRSGLSLTGAANSCRCHPLPPTQSPANEATSLALDGRTASKSPKFQAAILGVRLDADRPSVGGIFSSNGFRVHAPPRTSLFILHSRLLI